MDTTVTALTHPTNEAFLLGIEARGIAGAAALLDWIDRSVTEPVPGELAWQDVASFVEAHDWQDPTAMLELAMLALDFGTGISLMRGQ